MKILKGERIKPKWVPKVFGCWKPVCGTWRKYLGLTTIPGLQSVHNAQGKFATFAWSSLFVIGLSCTIRDVYISWMDYTAYPVTTAMNLRQAASLPFPAVTVCNLNRVHCGNLRRLARRNRGTDLGDKLERLYDVTNCLEIRRKPRNDDDDARSQGKKPSSREAHGNKNANRESRGREPREGNDKHYDDYTNDYWTRGNERKSRNRDNRQDYDHKGQNDERRFRRKAPGGERAAGKTTGGTTESSVAFTTTNSDEDEGKPLVNQTQSFNELMNFMALYANFSEEHRTAMGHDGEGFIRACTFSGKSCSNVTLFFKPILSSTFGNCFTFTTNRRTVMPGRDYGLSMELFLDQSNYIGGGLSPRAGARVVVHTPSQLPLPDENGLTVPPHTATSVALIQVEVSRAKLPYETNCTSGWDRTWYEGRVSGSYKYSMERCQRVCLQLAFEEACSCTHPSYMDLPTGAFPCNLTSDNENYACASQVLEEFETTTRGCSCNMDCREITYEMKISQAAWPNDNNWCNVAQSFGLARFCKEESQSEYRIRQKHQVLQNVLTIDVFFENLRIRSLDQHPTYKLQTFVGSLGGALSLYLGVTLFMLLEVVEVFLRVILALFQHGCCFIYQRGSTAVQNRSLRRVQRQNGIYYTDFRLGATRFPTGPKPIKPIKFIW